MTRKSSRKPRKAPASGPKRDGAPSSSLPTRQGLDRLEIREDLPHQSKETLIEVARLGKTWGIHGDITVRLHNPDSDLAWVAETVWLQGEAWPLAAVTVVKWQDKGGKILARFAGIDNPENGRALTGLSLWVPRDELGDAQEGEHFVHELIGMEVIDTERGPLGTIRSVFSAGASDVWVVHDGSTETLIPAIGDFVLAIDDEKREIQVRYELD